MNIKSKLSGKISEEEYLEGELVSDVKHEYINGDVYAMAGASKNHNLITKNTLYGIENSLRKNKSPCDIFSSDMKARVVEKSTSFFYPDVLVTCDADDNESDYFVSSSIIIVEVLSKSTKKYDLTTKKLYYFNIPTLQEYVVIEQDSCRIEVFRKSDNWKVTSYFLGDEITFESIDTIISVEDIYYHVNIDEITQFLKEKEQDEEKQYKKANA